MIKKLTKILGVALPVVLVLALAVGFVPALKMNTADAAAGTMRFGHIPLPKYDADGGKYVLVSDQNVGPMAVSPAGGVVFAASENLSTGAGFLFLSKSGDGGYTWNLLTGFTTATALESDTTPIVAVKTSPEYSTDGTVLVATQKNIYQSVDGGSTFSVMAAPWGTAPTITSMDVAMDSSGRLSIIVGTTTGATYSGEVYVYSPATTGLGWKAQSINGTGADPRNVLAVAFSKNFASDEGICAVTVNGTAGQGTALQWAFASTKTGGAWGTDIGNARFLDALAQDVVATRASIGFPDDFDIDSITTNIAFVGLYVGTPGAAGEAGDVYRVTCQPSASSAIDLNVRGLVSTVRTATNVWSMDVTGDAAAATIVVGTDYWDIGQPNYYWTSYYTTDSGNTWYTAREKAPTGGAPTWSGVQLAKGTDVKCYVVTAPDFDTSGVAYAGTSGADTSAFSRTANGCKSWNQISFIDYSTQAAAYVVNTFSVQNDWATSQTALMCTAIGGTIDGAVWKTNDGGAHYERIWSYANPTATRTILACSRAYAEANVGETIFAADNTNGKFWRSSDYGDTFPRVITAKETPVAGAFFVTPEMIWTYYANGHIWTTTNLGRPWVEPEETIINEGILFYAFGAGSLTLVPGYSGTIYVSRDGGVTFTETLGVSALPAFPWLFTDPNYAENGYVYGAGMAAPGAGVWRIKVNEEDPESSEWMRIDDNSANYLNFMPSLIMGKAGVTYVFCQNAMNAGGTLGGFWRSVNPDADVDSVNPPLFIIENTGLALNDVAGYKSWSSDPTTIFFRITNAVTPTLYYNQIMAYKDIMSAAPAMIGPDDGATEQGISLSTVDLTYTIILSWSAVTGAQTYEWRIYNDAEFTSTAFSGTTSGTQMRVDSLIPGRTYYWRVRVTSPLVSPWSAARSFTMSEVEAPEEPFTVTSPASGATDVPLQPAFVWAKVKDATSYEIVVSEDKTFAIIDWSHTSDQNFYQGEEMLAYNTTYYWRVRAAGGEWTYGVFTTMAEPEEPEPPIVIEPTPPPPEKEVVVVEVPTAPAIPDYLLWIIVGVGAVLFIALIVLILRTRRVP